MPSDLDVLVDSVFVFEKGVAVEAVIEEPHKPWKRPDGMAGPAKDFGKATETEYGTLLDKAVSDSNEDKYSVDPTRLTLVGDSHYFIKAAKSAARLYNRGRVEDIAIGLSEKMAYTHGAFNYLYDIAKVDLSVKGKRK